MSDGPAIRSKFIDEKAGVEGRDPCDFESEDESDDDDDFGFADSVASASNDGDMNLDAKSADPGLRMYGGIPAPPGACEREEDDPAPLDPTTWFPKAMGPVVEWMRSTAPFIVKDELDRKCRWISSLVKTQGERSWEDTQMQMALSMGARLQQVDVPLQTTSDMSKFLENVLRKQLGECQNDLTILSNEARTRVQPKGPQNGKQERSSTGDTYQEIIIMCCDIYARMDIFVNEFAGKVRIRLLDDPQTRQVACQDSLSKQIITHIDGKPIITGISFPGGKVRPRNDGNILIQYLRKSLESDNAFITGKGGVIIPGGINRSISPDGRVWFTTDGSSLRSWTTSLTKGSVPSNVLFLPYPSRGRKVSHCSLSDYAKTILNRSIDMQQVMYQMGSKNPIHDLSTRAHDFDIPQKLAAKTNPNMIFFKNGVLFNLNQDRNRDIRTLVSESHQATLGFVFVEWDNTAEFQRIREQHILEPNDTPHLSFPDVWFDRTVLSTNSIVDVYIPHIRSILAHQNYYYDHPVFDNIAAIFGLILGKPRGSSNVTFVILGEANSGKSLILKIVQQLVPEVNQATVQLGKGRSEEHGWAPLITNKHELNKSSLDEHARLAELLFSDELPVEFGPGLGINTLKSVMAGDEKIIINPKNLNQIKALVNVHFVICSNHEMKVPNGKEWDTISRRMLYIPFPNNIMSPEFGGSDNRDESLKHNLRQNTGAILVSLLARSSKMLRKIGNDKYLKSCLDPRLVKYTEMKFRAQSKVCKSIMAAVQCGWVQYPSAGAGSPDEKQAAGPASFDGSGSSVYPTDDHKLPSWVPLSKLSEFVNAHVRGVKSHHRSVKVLSDDFIINEIEKVWNQETNSYKIQVDEKYSTFTFMNQTCTDDKKVEGLCPGKEMLRDLGGDHISDDVPMDDEEQEMDIEALEESVLSKSRMAKISASSGEDPGGPDFGKEEKDKRKRDEELRFLKRHKLVKSVPLPEHFSRMKSLFIKSNDTRRYTSYLAKMIKLFKRLSNQYQARTALDRKSKIPGFVSLSQAEGLEDRANAYTLQHPMVIKSRSQLARLQGTRTPDWRSRQISQANNEEKHAKIEHIHSFMRQLNVKIKSSISYTTLARTACIINTLTVARFGLIELDGLMNKCERIVSASSMFQKQLRAYGHWNFLLKFFFGYDITAPLDPAQSEYIDPDVYSTHVTEWCAKLADHEPTTYHTVNEMVRMLAVGHLQSATTYCIVGGAHELFAPLFNGLYAAAFAGKQLWKTRGGTRERENSRDENERTKYPFLFDLTVSKAIGLHQDALNLDAKEIFGSYNVTDGLKPVQHALSVIGALLYDSTLCSDENYTFAGHKDLLKHCMNMTGTNPKRGSPRSGRIGCSNAVLNAVHIVLSATRSNAVCTALKNSPTSDILRDQFQKDSILRKLVSAGSGAVFYASGDQSACTQHVRNELLFLDPYVFDVDGILQDMYQTETKRVSGLCAMQIDNMKMVFWTQMAVNSTYRTAEGLNSCARTAIEVAHPDADAAPETARVYNDEGGRSASSGRKRVRDDRAFHNKALRKRGRANEVPQN